MTRMAFQKRQDSEWKAYFFAFEPICERVLLPFTPSDFSRGVNVSQQLLYAVGIMEENDTLELPFLKYFEHSD